MRKRKILLTGILIETLLLFICACNVIGWEHGKEMEIISGNAAENWQKNRERVNLGDFYGETALAETMENLDEADTEHVTGNQSEADAERVTEIQKDYIKWVDFNVSYEALCLAYELDTESHSEANTETLEGGEPFTLNWVELLAYAGARCGGEFGKNALSYIHEAAEEIEAGNSIEELTADMKYYNYYREAYGAVLDGMVGEYEVQTETGKWEKKYGLKAFSPIAKGFSYSDYDDFGASRSFGYKRVHLGHDMMGLVGTPIIAVEGGTVEALGWNQYGGWRIGIRSEDRKRYYYYAHLRQNRPYAEGLKEGDTVKAGEVIGYMGHTGYSTTENVNNIDEVHLHFGLQLIFDESQKEGNNEIWVDCYDLTKFLSKNRSEVVRNDETKEWTRKYDIRD